jgi:threonine aldolase
MHGETRPAPVDLRSDTVTRPGAAMRAAMAAADVGDDVFREDPTVTALEARVAALVGHEAGLFVPSGTMGNQIAILAHTRPGDEVVVGAGAHSAASESGGAAALAGVQCVFAGTEGHFGPDELLAVVHEEEPFGHTAPTRLVMLENTHNRAGGVVLPVAQMRAVRDVCASRGLALHLDGARLFNAAVAAGEPASAWGALADSVSVCLSKGLGAPVGSVLCGSRAFVRRAHRFRKMMGGGMRQAGILAAAGVYALDHHVERLADDHRRARRLAEGLARLRGVRLDPARVQTNIVIFEPVSLEPGRLCALVADEVRALPFGPGRVRLVTHLDVDDDGIERALAAFGRVLE